MKSEKRTLRRDVSLAIVSVIIAGCSYLRFDPGAPYSYLVYQPKQSRPWRHDPKRLERVIEEYDYLIEDPWDLGRTPEALEDLRQRRQRFLDLAKKQKEER